LRAESQAAGGQLVAGAVAALVGQCVAEYNLGAMRSILLPGTCEIIERNSIATIENNRFM
jgi:hypothetical protein